MTAISASAPIPVFDLGTMAYGPAQDLQRSIRASVIAGHTPGVLLLLEHPLVVTLGVRGSLADVLPSGQAEEFPVVRSERGGAATLHAPGQLVSYPILPVPKRNLRAYVNSLEDVIIALLADIGVEGVLVSGRPGVYVGERKIASLGLRCERWVASHGTSLNVDPDMNLFTRIVSCGQPALRQTSIAQQLGWAPAMHEMKARYAALFGSTFGYSVLALECVRPGDAETRLGLSR